MKKIPLGKTGKVALVDDEDYEFLIRWPWRYQSKGYAVGSMGVASAAFLMHRVILKAQKGQQIDHINHDKLDNRKQNLRFCNNGQNHMNIKKYANKTSKYKGVWWNRERGKWQTDIKLNKKKRYVGRFESEERAAQAYNVAAMKLFGDFALLNEVAAR